METAAPETTMIDETKIIKAMLESQQVVNTQLFPFLPATALR